MRTFVLVVVLVAACLALAHADEDPSVHATDMRLIEYGPDERVWLPTNEVVLRAFQKECGAAGADAEGDARAFMDVTEHPNLRPEDAPASDLVIPTELDDNEDLSAMLTGVDYQKMTGTVQVLSQKFKTRYHTNPSSVAAVNWLASTYKRIAARAGCRSCTVETFDHSWLMPSLIVRYPCKNCIDDNVIIIGGHADSITKVYDVSAPGADDDASGTSTVMEAFRVLVSSSKFKPRRTIEFHAYAAEEVGLLGSQDVAAAYQKRGVKVAGMLQLDMTAFVNGPSGFVIDYTDPDLTKMTMGLAAKYTSLDWQGFKCNYACSDHASWTKAGYRSATPFEVGAFDKMNHNIHTTDDTLDKIDMKHAAEYAKLAVAFAATLNNA